MIRITKSLVFLAPVLVFAACGPRPSSDSTVPSSAAASSAPNQSGEYARPPRLALLAELSDFDDALIKGDAARYLSHYSDQPGSILVGSSPDEVYFVGPSYSETIRRWLGAGGVFVRQTSATSYATSDNVGGVVFVEYEVLTWQGEQLYALPLRSSLVFTRDPDRRFRIMHAHTSVAVSDEDAVARVTSQTTPALRAFYPWQSPNATELAAVLTQIQQGDLAAERKLTAPDPNVVIVGTAPGEKWTGVEFAAETAAKSSDFVPSYTPPHAWVSESGTFGFAVFTVALMRPTGAVPVTIAQRVTEVYEKRGTEWRRVHAHASIPVAAQDLGKFMVAR